MLSRFKSALRILLKGDSAVKKRGPIRDITSDEVAEIRQFFARPKFFILGHARSGTTLLMRLARLHPQVHCNYQAHFFTRQPLLKSLVDTSAAEEWLTRRSNRWNQGGDLSPLVLRAAADFIMERDAAREKKMIVGDKSPSSTIHGQAVRDMHAIYPDAKLIYIIRDGRDVLISERFRNFVEESKFLTTEDKHLMQELRSNPQSFGNGNRSIFTETVIRRVTAGWVANLKEIEQEGRRLYAENLLCLRYEDLLEKPFEEMNRLWKFLGAGDADAKLSEQINAEMSSNPDGEWQAERNQGIAYFLPKGQAGNWSRLFTEKDKSIFKEIGGDMLVRWGYEKDQGW